MQWTAPTRRHLGAKVVVAVAQANKTARIVWALLHHGGTYQTPQTAI